MPKKPKWQKRRIKPQKKEVRIKISESEAVVPPDPVIVKMETESEGLRTEIGTRTVPVGGVLATTDRVIVIKTKTEEMTEIVDPAIETKIEIKTETERKIEIKIEIKTEIKIETVDVAQVIVQEVGEM